MPDMSVNASSKNRSIWSSVKNAYQNVLRHRLKFITMLTAATAFVRVKADEGVQMAILHAVQPMLDLKTYSGEMADLRCVLENLSQPYLDKIRDEKMRCLDPDLEDPLQKLKCSTLFIEEMFMAQKNQALDQRIGDIDKEIADVNEQAREAVQQLYYGSGHSYSQFSAAHTATRDGLKKISQLNDKKNECLIERYPHPLFSKVKPKENQIKAAQEACITSNKVDVTYGSEWMKNI